MVFFKLKISLEEVLDYIPWTYNLADTFISTNGHEEEIINFPCYASPAKVIDGKFSIGIYKDKKLVYVPVNFSSTMKFQTQYYGINNGNLYKEKKRRRKLALSIRATSLKIRLLRENRNIFLHDIYTIHEMKNSFPFILLEESHQGIMNYKFLRRLGSDDGIELFSCFNDSVFWEDYLIDLKRGTYSPPEDISESFYLASVKSDFNDKENSN